MEKHKIIPEGGIKPSKARYLRLKIMVPMEDYERGLPYFGSRRNLNQYVVESFRERVNRAEANDKAGRIRRLNNDADLLLPVIRELATQGKLDFLKNDDDLV
jgi:hypothetical protein